MSIVSYSLPKPGETLSHFVEGYQYAWDSTSLGYLKSCPKLYHYKQLAGGTADGIPSGWTPKRKSVHLLFGGWYQSGTELYDKQRVTGTSHEDAVRAVVRFALEATWFREGDEPGPWESGNNNKSRETLVRTLIWYLDERQHDKAKTVVLSDGRPAVELSFRMELDYGPIASQPYLLSGHLDKVVDLEGVTFVKDNKTTKNTLDDQFFDQFKPDNQMSLYTVASQVILQTNVRGVMIDGAQILVGGSRFRRGFTYRTPAELTEWHDDTKHWLAMAKYYTDEDYWPMNDKSCFLCDFRKVCQSDPGMRHRVLEKDFVRKTWNPLETR